MFGIGRCKEVKIPYIWRSDAKSASTNWKVVSRNRK